MTKSSLFIVDFVIDFELCRLNKLLQVNIKGPKSLTHPPSLALRSNLTNQAIPKLSQIFHDESIHRCYWALSEDVILCSRTKDGIGFDLASQMVLSQWGLELGDDQGETDLPVIWTRERN